VPLSPAAHIGRGFCLKINLLFTLDIPSTIGYHEYEGRPGMEQFVLDYVGDREVSFMMILDNAYYFRYQVHRIPYDKTRERLQRDVKEILDRHVNQGVLAQNEYNFYYRKDLCDE
jgi:hypothetical protein